MGETITILFTVWGIFITIAWLFIGWRAMIAHERIATAVERLAIKDKS